MNQRRPKNLNLFTIKFPIPAIISILHRITGVILFLMIPLILWGFSYSLTNNGFDTLQLWLDNTFVKILFWSFFIPFCFHLIAGIRHLLSDLHMGDTLPAGRITGIVTIIVSIILILMAGVWIW